MIGGKVIENEVVIIDDGRTLRRLWVVEGGGTLEAALYTPPEFAGEVKVGDTVWKQAGRLYHGDVDAGPHFGIRYAPFDGDTLKETNMQKNPQYTPCATYFHDSDCVEYVKHDAFSIYDRIDEFLTLIWDKTGQELVGFKLKGFKNIFTKRLRPHIQINDEQFLRIVSAIEHICVELGDALTADDETSE